MAEEARRRTTHADDLDTFVERLNSYLFDELGFHGNIHNYYDPENSYLNRVLDRRLGIPITLSVLYMEMAHRAGQPCEGIGLPGHFLVHVGPLEEERYVDPFNKGRSLHHADCQDLVHQQFGGRFAFAEEHLEPYTVKAILVRLLTNLKSTYFQQGVLPVPCPQRIASP